MNSDQLKAYNAVKNGENVFLSGSSGTGKSYTCLSIIEWARQQHKYIGVTSSTGTSAILINGKTIHSFLGIGLAKKIAADLFTRTYRTNKKTIQRLLDLELLIIDEISMISAELLEKISQYLSIIRDDTTPFGGIQVVLVGDFAQLRSVEGDYCFKADVWKRANIITVDLEKSMRQKDDKEFQDMLEELRWGRCTKDILRKLKSLKNTEFPEGIVPTILYAVNKDVDTINDHEMKKLLDAGATSCSYKSIYSRNHNVENWAKSLKLPETIKLCVGAQVLLTMNVDLDRGLANGSRGVVVGLNHNSVVVRFVSGLVTTIDNYTYKDDADESMWMVFMPLKLAWAITIHRSQGATLDAVVLDLGDSVFTYGMAYVALSRVRNLQSVKIIDVKAKSFRTHPDVMTFYNKQ